MPQLCSQNLICCLKKRCVWIPQSAYYHLTIIDKSHYECRWTDISTSCVWALAFICRFPSEINDQYLPIHFRLTFLTLTIRFIKIFWFIILRNQVLAMTDLHATYVFSFHSLSAYYITFHECSFKQAIQLLITYSNKLHWFWQLNYIAFL